MSKKIPLIEKIILSVIILNMLLSIVFLFVANKSQTFLVLKQAFSLLFGDLSNGGIWRTLAIIGILSTIFCFALYWVTNLLISKYLSFGPAYLLLFVFSFLFANSYYNVFLEVDIYFISVMILMIILFIGMTYSFVKYLIYSFKDVEVSNDKQ